MSSHHQPSHDATPSRFIAFFDECGDHSLDKINPEFPVFVLSTVIMERIRYVNEIVPAFAKLKLDFWDHEGVNLHTRDIRKQIGPFAFLQIPSIRPRFLARVSEMMKELRYDVFITAIRKVEYLDRHGDAATNPYEAALSSTMDSLIHLLQANAETCLPIIAEARGKVEDNSLEAAFYKLFAAGTPTASAETFRALTCPMTFVNKDRNVAGTQLADLCAYPVARHILRPSQPNQAYDIVRAHIYNASGHSGLTILP